MKYRKLRIAWSVAWGVVALLLVVLWVRSYTWHDRAALPSLRGIVFEGASWEGQLRLSAYTFNPPRAPDITGTEIQQWWSGPTVLRREMFPNSRSGFSFRHTTFGASVFVPHWFVALALTILSLVSWVPWWSKRFSLRTLLIATTLVAVVLGWIVWVVRS